MSLNTVCRICLAMDVPLYSIVDTPLQNIYEKLSSTPLNMCHRPVVACYICYAQLRKSHNLMVRSVRADRVLAQILLSDDIVKEESITLLNHEAYQHALRITPVELISMTGTEHNLIKTEIKEEPLLSQHDEGIETDRTASAECLTFEQSEEEAMEEVLLEDEHIESQVLIDEGDIKQEEEDPLNIFIPLKCINSKVITAGDMRPEREDMTRKQSEGAVMKTSCYVCRGISHIASDCPKRYKKKKVVTTGSNQINLGSKAARGTLETSDAAPAERYKETHADNIQDASTLTPDGQKIPEKPGIRTTDVEEATSRNMDRYVLQSTKKAIYKNSRSDSDTANKADICVVSDNVCPSTNTVVGDASSKHARRKFVCENCGTVFDDKCLLLEHIVHHVTVKKKSCRYSSRGAANEHEQTLSKKNLYQCEVCKVTFSRKSDLKLHLIRTEKLRTFECQICKRRFNDNGRLKIHSKIHTGEKPYKCDICKFRFNNKGSLTKHLRIHTGEKPYECEICKVRFNVKNGLKLHFRLHTGEKPYECETCKRRFNQKGSLNQHLRVHTGEKPYECEICKRRFSQKRSLKAHLRIHTGEKPPYQCETCKVRFNEKGSLKEHIRVHTGEKPYGCEICERRFSQKTSLRAHLRNHTGEKPPYQCETCKVRFNHRGSLKKHLRVHTGETPYECDICKFRFKIKSSLTKHLRIHTGEKPYECEICKVRFNVKNGLKLHFRLHTGEKPYECETCKRRFNQKGSLNQHLRVHTGEKPYECEICERRFSQKTSLRAHLRNHTGEKPPYQCETCKVRFNHRVSLKKHLRVHTGETPYECEICNVRILKKGNLNQHLRVHTGEKPYKCKICKIKFRHKSFLNYHLRNHSDEKT